MDKNEFSIGDRVIRVQVPADLASRAFNLIEDTLIESDIHFQMEVDIEWVYRRGY